MKWVAIIGVTVFVAVVSLLEWPKIKPDQKKEKAAFAALAAIGWMLAVVLVIWPEIPGPTQMVDQIFKPLGKIMEK